MSYVSNTPQGIIYSNTGTFNDPIGVEVYINNILVSTTPTDDTQYTWEVFCMNFTSSQVINRIEFTTSVFSYVGIDGICLEPIDTIDCTGTVNGTAIIDSCGICLEPNDPLFNQSCTDCAGTLNGTAIIDSCGICLEPDAPIFNQSCADCAGTPNGTAVVDICGVCLEPDDPNFDQSCIDCTGMINGSAIIDSCGICLEPGDPAFNQSCIDCTGTPNGTAIIDACGVCLDPDAENFNQNCTDYIFIPNAISPNGDGVNDIFRIFKKPEVDGKVNAYRIFTRWGELVFASNGFNFSDTNNWWNGEFRNRKVNPGVYVYSIDIELKDGNIVSFSGDITVLK